MGERHACVCVCWWGGGVMIIVGVSMYVALGDVMRY